MIPRPGAVRGLRGEEKKRCAVHTLRDYEGNMAHVISVRQSRPENVA